MAKTIRRSAMSERDYRDAKRNARTVRDVRRHRIDALPAELLALAYSMREAESKSER